MLSESAICSTAFDNVEYLNSNMNGLGFASAMLACMFVTVGVSKYARLR